MDDVPGVRDLRTIRFDQLLGALLHLGSVSRRNRGGYCATLGLLRKLHHQVRNKKKCRDGGGEDASSEAEAYIIAL